MSIHSLCQNRLTTQVVSDSNRDTPELPLSSSQMEVFDGWKRPEEIMLQPSIGVEDSNIGLGPTMVSHANVDLVQDITTDCSVVASLCAGTARAERGHVKVMQWHFTVKTSSC